MKKKKKKIILILLGIFVFYFFIPIPFITKNQELSIQESALTFLYNHQRYGPKESLQICYIQIGEGGLLDPFFDYDGRSYHTLLTYSDPTEQLLNRIKEWPVKIEPASHYLPADPNGFVARNEQGELGIFLSVGPIIKSMGLARCRTYYWKNGLNAAEYETFLIWTPLGWKHFFSIRMWGA